MTYQALACPGCASADITRRPALMAPFIARYVLDQAPEVCRLCRCGDCGLMFYQTRYDDTEIARLYDDYRGERYLAVRHGFEPWYTRKFNDDIGGPVGMAPRQAVYRATIAAHAGAESIGSVLDYAGDRGQMMQGGPGREHCVFDISGVAPAAGVTNIADARALAGRTFDLVLLCGVVEHFSEPLAQVQTAASSVRPDGLLYVEVPDEQFRIEAIAQGQWYEKYLHGLAHTRLPLLAVDFWSTGARVKLGGIPPLGFAKQHEHLNFFDVGSLARLLTTAGLEVLDCARATTSAAVVALCRRPDREKAGAT